MNEKPTFWFPAKRFGWGWGLPVRWQGWVVLALYAVLVSVGVPVFMPQDDVVGFTLYSTAVTLLLLVIVFIKGERPVRWRWGKE